MADATKRQREREVKIGGGIEAAAAAAADARRTQNGIRRYLDQYKGYWLYIEGNKMNYVVYCLDVVYDVYDVPMGIVCSPAYRVGDWGAQGVAMQHCQRLPSNPPRFLQFFGIADIGPAPKTWVESCEAAPDDGNVAGWEPIG